MTKRNTNNLVVPGSYDAINQFKLEIAEEIGLHNYNSMDKGWLASRQNGYVGGNMTRKMVSYAEQAMRQQGAEVMSAVNNVPVDVPQDVKQLNELASQNFEGFKATLYGIQQGQQPTQDYIQ